MERIKCLVCGQRFSVSEIYGFYYEDDSFVCRNCFGNKQRNFSNKKKKTVVSNISSK